MLGAIKLPSSGVSQNKLFNGRYPMSMLLGPTIWKFVLVVVFVFNVPPTAKVIWRWGHGLKSHPTEWLSRESNLRPLVYKASGLSTTPQRRLEVCGAVEPKWGRNQLSSSVYAIKTLRHGSGTVELKTALTVIENLNTLNEHHLLIFFVSG